MNFIIFALTKGISQELIIEVIIKLLIKILILILNLLLIKFEFHIVLLNLIQVP